MKKRLKGAIFVVIALILVASLVFTFGIFTTKEAVASACPPEEILCGDNCYSVEECYLCEDVSGCGALKECLLQDRQCNGGSGSGGLHFCYCNGDDPT